MIPTPTRLAELLRRRTPPTAEPKPDPAPGPDDAPVTVPEPPTEPAQPPRITPRTWLDATLSEMDVYRESVVLDELAKLTDRLGPREAAMRLFGGHR